MFGLAETNLFSAETLGDLAHVHRLRPRLQHGLLRSISELGFGEQTEDTVAAAKAWLADNGELSTIEMFSVLGEWAGARSVIEKSPFHVYKIESLRRMQRGFPEAYYLHLTRHPVATWVSNKELRGKIADSSNKNSLMNEWAQGQIINKGDLDIEKLWLQAHLTIMEFLEGVPEDHQLRIRGEELLENPRFYFAQICEWLGKRYDEDAVEAMMHPEQSPFAKYGPRNARFGNDPKFMESPELRPYKSKPMPLDGIAVNGATVPLSQTIVHYAEYFGY